MCWNWAAAKQRLSKIEKCPTSLYFGALHCKCLHPECNQGCKFWVQQILFAIFAIDIWNCCNYLLLQFYDAKIHVSICRVCKLKLHIWLQKLAAIIDCNNCIQSATGHVTLVKVAVLATQVPNIYSVIIRNKNCMCVSCLHSSVANFFQS